MFASAKNKIAGKSVFACTLALLSACGQSKPADEPAFGEHAVASSIQSEPTVTERPEARIATIKEWYGAIQKAGKIGKCTIRTATHMDGFSEEKFPFTNTFESCQLKDNFSYEVVTLNGYEWTEKCTWYYKDGVLFFVFDRGASEACAYEARVYYDVNGNVIQVLSAENECDGNVPGASKPITDKKRQQEILDQVALTAKELRKAMRSEDK